MAKIIPGMAYPHNSDEHGLFAYTICVKVVSNLLYLFIGFNNLSLSSICDSYNFIKLPYIFEEVISILSILFSIFPN